MSENRSLIAWSSMLIIGILWGGTIPLTKIAVSTGHQPLGLIVWQLLLGAIILGTYLVFKGWRPNFERRYIIFYTAIAFLGTIFPNGFSYWAASELPAGVMSITIATVPMFTLVIALSLRLETPALGRILGVLIGFTAMVMIAAPQTSLPDPSKALFVVVALVAPFFYGAESNYIAAKTPSGTDPVSTLFMASCIGFIIVVPSALISGQWMDITQPWGSPEYALVASSIIHVVTYVGYIWLVGYGGPVFSVQVAYPVTISGVFLSILFLGEGYSSWIWSALILVIIGLALVQPKLDTFTAKEQTNG